MVANEPQRPILNVPESVIDEAIKVPSSARQTAWSPVDPDEVVLAFASPEVRERANRSSWSPISATAFMNRYQYPLAAFIQGLWCDEKDTERAMAANRAAWIGDAVLRLQTIKCIDKLNGYTAAQQQEILDTLSGRDFHTFLHRKYKTTDPLIATASHKHQLSQIENANVLARFPRLVRIPLLLSSHIYHTQWHS